MPNRDSVFAVPTSISLCQRDVQTMDTDCIAKAIQQNIPPKLIAIVET
jgi:hypothetical protein